MQQILIDACAVQLDSFMFEHPRKCGNIMYNEKREILTVVFSWKRNINSSLDGK